MRCKSNSFSQYLGKISVLTIILTSFLSETLSLSGSTNLIESDELLYTWKINNFTTLKESGIPVILSPIFPAMERRENQWQLQINTDSSSKFNNRYGLSLVHFGEAVTTSYSLFLIDDKGEQIKSLLGSKKYVDGSVSGGSSIVDWDFTKNNNILNRAAFSIKVNVTVSKIQSYGG